MKFLVDANVLSEATRPDPDQRVVAWLRRNESMLAVDPIILGEIRYGINLLPKGKRRQSLEQWFERGVMRINCIDWTAETGIRWAGLLADLRRAGRSMPIKDSLIAATALHHDVKVATRNVGDFRKARVEVVNPFS